jgi:hypothetical protein
VLPIGISGQTLRHNGSNWVANSALTSDGTNVALDGTLAFFSVARGTAGGNLFLLVDPDNNTFLGGYAGSGISGTGFRNVAVGGYALSSNTSGDENVALGTYALEDLMTGNSNIGIGNGALANVDSGSGNIAIGANVGTVLTSGSNNIYIGSPNAGNESGQIRIGNNAIHTGGAVFTSIYGYGSVGGIGVLVNSGGRLGTTTSSRRFKEEIRDIGADSDGLMNLRPVAFKYKRELDPTGVAQYGLIAEEMAEVYPELVVYDEQGRPENIRYHLLDALLLNEIQKQHRSLETQKAEIEDLKAQLAKLQARFSVEQLP